MATIDDLVNVVGVREDGRAACVAFRKVRGTESEFSYNAVRITSLHSFFY